jgi:hypothetical protein
MFKEARELRARYQACFHGNRRSAAVPMGSQMTATGVFALTGAGGAVIEDGLPCLAEFIADFERLDAIAANGMCKVRKAPSWPRSWANFSLLQLYSHRGAWANLHLLGQPDTFLAADPGPSPARRAGEVLRRAPRAQRCSACRGPRGHSRPPPPCTRIDSKSVMEASWTKQKTHRVRLRAAAAAA